MTLYNLSFNSSQLALVTETNFSKLCLDAVTSTANNNFYNMIGLIIGLFIAFSSFVIFKDKYPKFYEKNIVLYAVAVNIILIMILVLYKVV